jgi:hypothetical protein
MAKSKSTSKSKRSAAVKKVALRKKKVGKKSIATRSTKGVDKKRSKATPKKAIRTRTPARELRTRGVNKIRSGASALLQQTGGWQVVDIANGIAIHDAQFKSVHYLNHTAAAIFLLCQKPISEQDIVLILAEEFDLQPAQKGDIMQAVETMKRVGVIAELQDRQELAK